jgi:tryptophan halogenase
VREGHAVKKVVIAGGGTAGWMAAALMAKVLGKGIDITLIESEEIGTVGVGEATIPTLLTYNHLLGVNEQEFMAKTQGTFKLGIEFANWREVGHRYIHAFGITGKDHWTAGFQHFWRRGIKEGVASAFDDYCLEAQAAWAGRFAQLPDQGMHYAYHLDASLYARFLRELAEQHGTVRREGKIVDVSQDGESGYVTSVTMADGTVVEGDLFVDCSGFRGLLIEQTLHTGYEDWTHWLPCDSAVAVQTASVADPVPYTRSTALDAGWQWRIPLQHRVGNGHVFCSRNMSDDEAVGTLLDNIEGERLVEPRVLKFRTGTRRKHWNRNVVALGLASGFIEPLESTSIHLIQRGIVRLMRLFPNTGIKQADIDEFNAQTKFETDGVRDFIILHYHVTDRRDTPFWRQCAGMDIPDSLRHRIDLFRDTGRVFKMSDELFAENSWTQVMLGQGLMPEQHHPVVDVMSEVELKRFLTFIRGKVTETVAQLPTHQQYLQRYCPAEK